MALRYTTHATTRQAQRNLSRDDVAFIVAYGRRVRSGGALHIFLGRRDLPHSRDLIRRYEHLEGTVLVVDDASFAPVLITAYRNRRALKAIRCKAKYVRR
jgi:hypothetical protein